jgi:hypothetical protein
MGRQKKAQHNWARCCFTAALLATRSGYAESHDMLLICRGFFRAIDEEDFDRTFLRFEAQAELLWQGGKNRGPVRIGRS